MIAAAGLAGSSAPLPAGADDGAAAENQIAGAPIAGTQIAEVLGLPDYNPGSLSDAQTRAVYVEGEIRMGLLDARLAADGLNAPDRARIMIDQRNALRTWARTLMSNRSLAEDLDANDPNRTFDDPVASGLATGLNPDAYYGAMIDNSTRSRASVNESLGVDPDNPPPLPPVLPSRPFYGGGSADIELGR